MAQYVYPADRLSAKILIVEYGTYHELHVQKTLRYRRHRSDNSSVFSLVPAYIPMYLSRTNMIDQRFHIDILLFRHISLPDISSQ